MIARGLPNRAVPVTAALCLAVACRLAGSVPHGLLGGRGGQEDIRIGHPSGVWSVAAAVTGAGQGATVESASVSLTARRLFQGEVLVPATRIKGVRLPA
jgi:2-methylaconitate cis-trans-isomerase PrpF